MIKNEFLKQVFMEEQYLRSAPKEFIVAGFLSAYTGLLVTPEDLKKEEKILEKAETTLDYLMNLIKRNGTKLDDKHVRSLIKDIIVLLTNSYKENTHDRKIALLPALNLGVQLYRDIYAPNMLTLNQEVGLQNCCELHKKIKELLEEMQNSVQEKDYIKDEILKFDRESLSKRTSALKQQGTTGAKVNTSSSGEKLGSKVLNETRFEELVRKNSNSNILANAEYLEQHAPELKDLFNQGTINFANAINLAKSLNTPKERLEAVARAKDTKKSINTVINIIKRKSAALGTNNEEFKELPEAMEIFIKPGIIVTYPLYFWENEELAQKKIKLISRILNNPKRDMWYVHDTDEHSEKTLVTTLKTLEQKIKISKYDTNGKKID